MVKIGNLQLDNITEKWKEGIDPKKLYSGDIYLKGKIIGTFKENYFDEPMEIDIYKKRDGKSLERISELYFKKYPAIVKVQGCVVGLITELVLLTIIQSLHQEDGTIAVVFDIKDTKVYTIGDKQVGEIMKIFAYNNKGVSHNVKLFILRKKTDLCIEI